MKYRIVFSICLFFWAFSGLMAQQEGLATYYADKYHGKSTASGELYNMNAFTAAHRTLAFGSMVRVTRMDNGMSVIVRINDRGPFTQGRIIDLSRAAADELDMLRTGETRVRVVVLEGGVDPTRAEASVPKPQPNANQDLSGLQLRDFNGNVVTPSGSVAVDNNTFDTNTGYSDYVDEAAMDPELAKYTPAIFQMVAFKKEALGYGVQVGAYFSYYRLMEAMNELNNKGLQNTLVQNGVKDGKPVFRIILGPYDSRREADQTRKSLRSKRIKGITVDLAELY